MQLRGSWRDRISLCVCTLIVTLVALPTAGAQPGSYVWKSVIAGGGGFIPGIVYHPGAPGLVYARTDMGGAYRWDEVGSHWIPLHDMMTRANSDYMGILSIGLDRNDTNRVYMECGKYTQSSSAAGAVLASTDKGTTWTINPLTVKIGGNENGRGAGERLQVDPNLGSILFMGTTVNGLWKSTNYGSTWTRVSTFTPTNINFVLFDPSTGSPGNATRGIFAAAVNTAGQSLYRSTDGGSTWATVPGQPTGVMAVRSALADTLLYVTAANNQGPNGATSGSVWKYGIPSGTWANITPATGSYGYSGIALYPPNPSIVIVSTLDKWSPVDEVYLSTNGGGSWTARLTTGTFDHSYAPYTAAGINPHWLGTLAMDPFDSARAMFGTGYGIWACDNMNAPTPTWYFKDQNLEETVPMQIVSPPFSCLLSAMGDIDGFRHDNLDVSPPNRWSPAKGTTLSIAYAGKVPSKLVKGYNTSPYGAYSTDGGSTWHDFTARPTGANGGGSWMIALSADGNTIVWTPSGGAMSFSTNGGRNWTGCGGGVPAIAPVADRVNARKIYAYQSGNGRMWVSTDGGKTFSLGVTGLPTVSNTQDGNATAVPGHEGDVWICCATGGLYRSTNSGASAGKIATVSGAYRLGFGKASAPGGYPAVYLAGTVNGILGFYRSDDTGGSWTRINDDTHQYGWVHQITGDLRVYGRCYISAEGRGIAYGQPPNSDTTDNPSTFGFLSAPTDSLRQPTQQITVTWSRASDPQGNPLVYLLHFFGPGVDTVLAGTDTTATFAAGAVQPLSSYVLTGYATNGFDTTASSNAVSFVSASLVTAVGSSTPGIAQTFALYQNYPNPFNPQTTIAYALPHAGNVTLRVYDLLGQEIASLVRNQKEAAGRHEVSFNAGNLPSGIYFYRLQADRYISTRQMVLIK